MSIRINKNTVFSIPSPPPMYLCICSIFICPATKSMMWRSDPLSNKYVFESKYIHIYFVELVHIEYCSNHSVSHICSISKVFLKRFPTRSCVALFIIKVYGRDASTYTHGLYLVQALQMESRLL